MALRVRTKSEPGVTGFTRSRSGGINTFRTQEVLFERCSDNPLVGDGHDFDVEKNYISGGLIQQHDTGNGFVYMKDFPADPFINSTAWSHNHIVVPGKPTVTAAATELLAKTNPSRSHVDLPLAVFELKDIPSLLKREGTLLRHAAHTNLGYHFGLAPLISDLKKLMDFNSVVHSRSREINALFKSGLRRKRVIASGSVSDGPISSTLAGSDSTLPRVPTFRTTSYVMWAYTRWRPITKAVPAPEEMLSLAKRAVYGLTLDFNSAWQIIPFSWLVDYAANVSDFLMATRNIIGHAHGPVQVMTHETHTLTMSSGSHLASNRYQSSWSAGTVKNEWKIRRKVTSASLSASLPFLNSRQLSILGSIGVTRRSRGSNPFANG